MSNRLPANNHIGRRAVQLRYTIKNNILDHLAVPFKVFSSLLSIVLFLIHVQMDVERIINNVRYQVLRCYMMLTYPKYGSIKAEKFVNIE